MNGEATAGLPTLEGRQVRLRQLGPDDLGALHAVFSDARVMRYWSHAPLHSRDDIAWYLRDIDAGRRHGTHFQWGIERRACAGIIGTLTLFGFDRARSRAEVGYALAQAHWGAGHARDAVRLGLDFAFQLLSLQAVEARVDRGNAASLRLLVALGFVRDDIAPSARIEHDGRLRFILNNDSHSRVDTGHAEFARRR